jgi:hypothetical protein
MRPVAPLKDNGVAMLIFTTGRSSTGTSPDAVGSNSRLRPRDRQLIDPHNEENRLFHCIRIHHRALGPRIIKKEICMFEKLRIKEHMEIAGSDGEHVGTVDKVEGEQIKLTKTDAADHQHHYIALDQIDRIEDNRIYLKVTKAEAKTIVA